MESDQVSTAIIVWTGWGRSSWPTRENDAVTRKFGHAQGSEILDRVLELANDFDRSSARFEYEDLTSMGQHAAADFRARHPDIGEDAVRALAWCYTYDSR